MKKQKGFAATIAVAMIIGAFVIGMVFKKATDHVDSPLEQAAEHVLSKHGIEVDFSADKKKEQAVK